jgi:hypothetical protein
MGVIGYAAIILAATRRAVLPLASPLASRQSKSVAGGRLVERLSIVRWMGLGLTTGKPKGMLGSGIYRTDKCQRRAFCSCDKRD